MHTTTFERESRVDVSASEALAWHARPGALERLLPPWQRVRVLAASGSIEPGSKVTLSLPLGPLTLRWTSEHRSLAHDPAPEHEPLGFRDVQLRGPFAHWDHSHQMVPRGEGRCLLRDRIEYALPGGALTHLLLGRGIERSLDRAFAYRHRTARADLLMHHAYRLRPRLHLAVSGASGLVGSALVAMLRTGGHEVLRLVRGTREPAADEARWDPDRGLIDAERVDGLDALVHLAGENIAAGRWGAERRRRIETSRVAATERLVASLAELAHPPRTLLNASAIGYYGAERPGEVSEQEAAGEGFLAAVCRGWEGAAETAAGICERVVRLRFGVVLSPAGGALAKMLPVFRAGLGGVVGSGEQQVSWISLDDAVAAIHFLLMEPEVAGAVNLTAPEPVSNHQLTTTLGRRLRRPTLTPLPAAAVRLLFGEMGRETLLGSCRALPRRLEQAGYTFRHPGLELALSHLLGC